MNDRQGSIDLLKKVLRDLQDVYEIASELSEDDFCRTDGPPTTAPEMEQVARIVDDAGYDGGLFRWLFKDNDAGWLTRSLRTLRRQIELLPRVIAKLEQSYCEQEATTPAAAATTPSTAASMTTEPST